MTDAPAPGSPEASASGGRASMRGLPAPLGALAAGSAAAAAVAFVDPYESGHYPVCPSLTFTGMFCPGCGGLRMAHSLLHGDVAGAFGMNPLVMVLLPVFAYLWVRWAVSGARGVPMRSVLIRPRVLYAFLGVLAVYWIVRNLPFAQVLAP